MNEAGTQRTAPAARPGRHRRAATAETWTPAVDPAGRRGRHRASELPTEEIAAVVWPSAEQADEVAGALPSPRAPRPARSRKPVARPAAQRPAEQEQPAWPVYPEQAAEEPSRVAAVAIPRSREPEESAPAEPARKPARVAVNLTEAPVVRREPEEPSDAETTEPAFLGQVLKAEPKAEPQRIPPALAGPALRTKITLEPAVEESDEVRVYLAPSDGLSTFDLGNVPASVTPPRSWRKAAWFATVSSGGVAVALLLAGSYMVGQQPQNTVAVDGWTGFEGKPPVVHDEGISDGSGDPTGRSSNLPSDNRTSSSAPQRISDVAGVHPSRSSDGTTTPGDDTSTPGEDVPSSTPGDPTDPTRPPEPQKPTPSPADRETKRDSAFNFPPSAEVMGDRSETFLNEITEDPQAAHEQTGGELYDEGAESIARRYDDIAYFEVEHIYIDQKNRVTVNTVNVMYKDGTSETQQCTLRFQDGDRITQDCG